jgi:aminotransferase in exopolysaccharide biosynthesis
VNNNLIEFIRDHFQSDGLIPLHAPFFNELEKEYVSDTIQTTFVSSIGTYVNQFEKELTNYTSSPAAIATVNGTAALHISLKIAGVEANDLVITQPLTFVATCNAISYLGAEPIFIDVDRETLGLSPISMENWLKENAQLDDTGVCKTKIDKRTIKACVPVHTFGHPANLTGLARVAKEWGLKIVEDSTEALGSFYKKKHAGTYGDFGTLSFNGNKIITTGGGGMILTDSNNGNIAKHLTTTAKKNHPYEYIHDEVGFNYRLPNINAALGCAQMKKINSFIIAKRSLAKSYEEVLKKSDLLFVKEPIDCFSNYWLNAVICENKDHRNELLEITNKNLISTRPIWRLINTLKMYKHCRCDDLKNSKWLEERIVNIPSSVRIS